jgi:hypothetical protein
LEDGGDYASYGYDIAGDGRQCRCEPLRKHGL